jgi:DNA-binding transcriptional ArsR family regulator
MPPIANEPVRAEHVASILKALGHPLRIRIISVLVSDGTCHVGGLAEQLGAPQSIISQHLRILRMQRLVTAARRDGFAWYELAEPQLVQLLACLEGCKQH